MDELWRVELLGGLRLRHGDQTISRFRTQKTAALLARLAYKLGDPLTRDELMEMLWPQCHPKDGRNRLNVELSWLRQQMELPGIPGKEIITGSSELLLDPQKVRTDLIVFESLARRAEKTESPLARIPLLVEAVELYHDPLLPNFDQDWIEPARERLAQLYLQLVSRLTTLLLENREPDRAVAFAARAVEKDRYREEAHCLLIRALLDADRPIDALRRYQDLARILDEDIGAEPSPMARRLEQEAKRRAQASKDPPAPRPRPQEETGSAAALPEGTVTLLIAELAPPPDQETGERYDALKPIRARLIQEFGRYGGHLFKEVGESLHVAFASAREAVRCAVACQKYLAASSGPDMKTPVLRVALHAGEAAPRHGDYRGALFETTLQLAQAAHYGQILVSEEIALLLRSETAEDLQWTDLGVFRTSEAALPHHLWQVESTEMPAQVRALPRVALLHTPALPPVFSRFVGRETELHELKTRLREPGTSLLTLLGSGGNGKTRLAIEVARQMVEPLSGAVWFVPLSDLSESHALVGSFRNVLQLPSTPGREPLDQVVDALGAHPSLLVLDNFEHLVETAAGLVRTMLERIPTLKCLVTSRQSLRLSMEQTYEVGPLPVPFRTAQFPEGSDRMALTSEEIAENPSVQLFVDRARKVRFDFTLTERNAAAIAETCCRLDGIPLAIELAAAWIRVLTPAQMRTQLNRVLVSREQDVPERHRSLQAVMEASCQRLTPDLKRFFTRLSVFRGGWTADAAETVCAEPLALELLTQLREASLVLAEDRGESMRFRMLEPLREYAEAHLQESGEATGTAEAHRLYFLALAQGAEAGLRGKEQAEWLSILDEELPNLRVALQAATAQERLQAAAALQRFWLARGNPREGRKWLEEALPEIETVPPAAQGQVLRSAGILAWLSGDLEAARQRLLQSLTVCRANADPRGIVMALGNLANIANLQGDLETARREQEASLSVARSLNDPQLTAIILNNLAMLCSQKKDLQATRAYLKEALALVERLGDDLVRADLLHNLADTDCEERDYNGALRSLCASLEIRRRLGEKSRAPHLLTLMALVAVQQQWYRNGVRLFGAAEAGFESMGMRQTEMEKAKYAKEIEIARAQFSPQVFQDAWQEGRAWSLDQAMEVAITEAKQWLDEPRS